MDCGPKIDKLVIYAEEIEIRDLDDIKLDMECWEYSGRNDEWQKIYLDIILFSKEYIHASIGEIQLSNYENDSILFGKLEVESEEKNEDLLYEKRLSFGFKDFFRQYPAYIKADDLIIFTETDTINISFKVTLSK